MTDDQFERIKKGLNFHSEGGVYNLCTLTETTLRAIIEDAVKFYEKQQKIDAEQIRALQKQNGELTDQVYELKDRLNEEIELHQHAEDYIKSLEAQIEKMKCDLLELRNDSYDAGMYLRIDELIQKWEIKEND